MNPRGPQAGLHTAAVLALFLLAACGDEPSALLPRNTVVPVNEVSRYFPDVTQESSTGPNETRVGKPLASRSVVFTSADGNKKVTLFVDQYTNASEAASAYRTAVQWSKAAPGFKPVSSPALGEEAFAGTSQVGDEKHFGLGARDGALIVSATHGGDIAVTPENSSNLVKLGAAELTVAKEILEPSKPAQEAGKGRVTIVYQDDAIRPENKDVIKTIRDSGVFERMADRLTRTVALPHDLVVVVTDELPKGVDDPNTELDGRRIFWPAAFSKDTQDVLAAFVPEVIRDKGAPEVIAQENFTAEALNVWGSQFILGHELGHAVIHQLNLPLTGLEEDSADGFGTFFTVNDKETGPNAALGAAVLFDAMGSKRPNLTMEDFSSDHEVIQQRVFNFLCAALGNDPKRLNSLVTDGYIPELRAMMCGKEWSQLNYGWWTMLEPHLTSSARAETEAVRKQARQDLEDENAALFAKFKAMRGQE